MPRSRPRLHDGLTRHAPAPARRALACLALATVAAAPIACRAGSGGATQEVTLLHLADALEGAAVTTAQPAQLAPRRWTFDAPRPEWRTLSFEQRPHLARVSLEQAPDAVRVRLARSPSPQGPFVIGGLVVDLGDLRLDDWEAVHVRARSSERMAGITVAYNVEEEGSLPGFMTFVDSNDETPPVFNDGSVQTYAIPLRRRGGDAAGALRSVGVLVGGPGEASLDILAIELVPRGGAYDQPVGGRSVVRGGTTRHTLYAQLPATLSFPLRLGEAGGRLDLGFAVEPGQEVRYRVAAEVDGERRDLLDVTTTDALAWDQRTVDLAALAGEEGSLVLEATSERPGAVALWGAPIVSGGRREEAPNVVFYVIDGAGADLMSLYGYGRPTTPFLERLAKEGVVFEHAYSNATWTQPSTVSFMTSLQHSVLGGLRRGVHSTPVPKAAVTMAERFRRGGYLTASFTTNPNAMRLVGLERNVDYVRDIKTEHHSTSSTELHERFWELRKAYPGGPWWVHFQTTDVHEPNQPVAPFKGRFVSAQQIAQADEWEGRMWQSGGMLFGTTSIAAFYDQAMERAGIPKKDYLETRRGLYDETMAYQDRALEQFVKQLRDAGEWENTILVIGADHGHPAGTFTRFGRGLLDPQPDPWQGALFESYLTRVPLLVVWPGKLKAGTRVAEPVSMIDVLPTLLDLAGLPAAEVSQGHSLAPLLRGERMRVRPVVLDEFRVDEASGEMIGNLEIVGGRWGAVHPFFPEVPRLLLYDLEKDPLATRAVNDEHPELVAKYREILQRQWEAHRALSRRFGEAGEAAVTPEQLEQLKALGYIQ